MALSLPAAPSNSLSSQLSSMSSSPPSSSSPSGTATTGKPLGLWERLRSPLATPRARKQAALFVLGAAGVVFSASVTRRALAARHRGAMLRPFTSAMENPPRFNGPAEAVQALSLATMNVGSFALMMMGGTLWAMDVSSLDDLRRIVRGGLGADGSGRSEQAVEEDFEEWVASALARKEQKEAARRQAGLDPQARNERGKER